MWIHGSQSLWAPQTSRTAPARPEQLQAPVKAAKQLCRPLPVGLRKITPPTFPLCLGGGSGQLFDSLLLPMVPRRAGGSCRSPASRPARVTAKRAAKTPAWGDFLYGVHHGAPDLRAGPTRQRQMCFLHVTLLMLHQTPPEHEPFPAEGALEEPLSGVPALVV